MIFKGGQVVKNGGQLRGRRTDGEKMADNLEKGGWTEKNGGQLRGRRTDGIKIF